MQLPLIFFLIGISIVIFTHTVMFVQAPSIMSHAGVNLFAAGSISYYFLNKEGYISF